MDGPPEHAARIAEVSVDTVKTGLGGAAGNKGCKLSCIPGFFLI